MVFLGEGPGYLVICARANSSLPGPSLDHSYARIAYSRRGRTPLPLLAEFESIEDRATQSYVGLAATCWLADPREAL